MYRFWLNSISRHLTSISMLPSLKVYIYNQISQRTFSLLFGKPASVFSKACRHTIYHMINTLNQLYSFYLPTSPSSPECPLSFALRYYASSYQFHAGYLEYFFCLYNYFWNANALYYLLCVYLCWFYL